MQIYEEVAKMPPFQRRTLVLIGAQGVGRRSLKNRFIVLNPTKFGTTVPCKCCEFSLLFVWQEMGLWEGGKVLLIILPK